MITPPPDLVPPAVIVLFPKGLEQITPDVLTKALGAMFTGAVLVVSAVRYAVSFFRNIA